MRDGGRKAHLQPGAPGPRKHLARAALRGLSVQPHAVAGRPGAIKFEDPARKAPVLTPPHRDQPTRGRAANLVSLNGRPDGRADIPGATPPIHELPRGCRRGQETGGQDCSAKKAGMHPQGFTTSRILKQCAKIECEGLSACPTSTRARVWRYRARRQSPGSHHSRPLRSRPGSCLGPPSPDGS